MEEMSRFGVLVFFVIFSVFLSVKIGHTASRTFSEIRKSGELRICYTPWMGTDKKKDFPSPFLETAVEFSKNLALKPVTKTIQWNEQFYNEKGQTVRDIAYMPALFEHGVCDLYANALSKDPWRERLMIFNWIYLGRNVVVVHRKNNNQFRSVRDLAGKKTAVVPNTVYHRLFEGYNREHVENPVQMNFMEKGGSLSVLLKEEVDFIVMDSTISLYAKFHLHHPVEIAFPIGSPDPAGWSFPKNSAELAKRSIKYFREESMKQNSAVNQIFRKYFGVSLSELNSIQSLITSE